MIFPVLAGLGALSLMSNPHRRRRRARRNPRKGRFAVRRFTTRAARGDARCFEVYDTSTGKTASFPGTKRDMVKTARAMNHEAKTSPSRNPSYGSKRGFNIAAAKLVDGTVLFMTRGGRWKPISALGSSKPALFNGGIPNTHVDRLLRSSVGNNVSWTGAEPWPEMPNLKRSNPAMPEGVDSRGTRYKLKKDTEWRQWALVAYVNGKRHEDRTLYFPYGSDTTSAEARQDAENSLKHLLGMRSNPRPSIREFRRLQRIASKWHDIAFYGRSKAVRMRAWKQRDRHSKLMMAVHAKLSAADKAKAERTQRDNLTAGSALAKTLLRRRRK
jgi:hypothetical protein